MQVNRLPPDRQEPIGIVIADGRREVQTPQFSAFVWSAAPEEIDFHLDVSSQLAASV